MHSSKNIFEQRFDRLSESLEHADSVRAKLIEGVFKLSEARRFHNNKQVIYTQKEAELSKLMASNQNLKLSLMETLIEREELVTKKTATTADIEALTEQLEGLEDETNRLLNDDTVNLIVERFSTINQLSLMNKIEDAKCKLVKYGYPHPDRLE